MSNDKGQDKKRVAVMGAGSWGTAIATALAVNGHDIRLWGRNASMMADMQSSRENSKYLPGVKLDENITCVSDAEAALKDAAIAVYVVPAQSFRSTFEATNSYISDDAVVVNCSKGIEQGTLMRISEIAEEIRPDLKFAVLSGPSHAEEVGKKLPTTLVSASADINTAQTVQDLFMSEFMRVYTNDDVIGVEIGGALKNIIALAAGISDGMGYGDNAKAALMTRAMTEISRLGVRLGAEKLTFMGLAGIGDLIVTCTSMHSRNRRCGIMIGEGMAPDEAVEKVGMVVEGMYTTEAAYEISRRYDIEMPITEQLYRVIKGDVSGPDAVRNLMMRRRRHEEDE
ncbi:MAG: NAD(P)H-dependent glycerol-3-phosphate dehydrogenase [Anaerovoracaceae bacterium]|nr:NAD(P)H-dependent glycerol-3-phosphate dehydrogenase [Bacillota bacterium]MDD7734206.1 NAD(P)H-dependent glycerol-3-phosphate dehydrogenase [Bacillota bacterium]MDY5907146.1 NAD(P)H-dependent glycerol-3-phosphate dehydrogenase [Anaerovoracaceae bacterium]